MYSLTRCHWRLAHTQPQSRAGCQRHSQFYSRGCKQPPYRFNSDSGTNMMRRWRTCTSYCIARHRARSPLGCWRMWVSGSRTIPEAHQKGKLGSWRHHPRSVRAVGTPRDVPWFVRQSCEALDRSAPCPADGRPKLSIYPTRFLRECQPLTSVFEDFPRNPHPPGVYVLPPAYVDYHDCCQRLSQAPNLERGQTGAKTRKNHPFRGQC